MSIEHLTFSISSFNQADSCHFFRLLIQQTLNPIQFEVGRALLKPVVFQLTVLGSG